MEIENNYNSNDIEIIHEKKKIKLYEMKQVHWENLPEDILFLILDYLNSNQLNRIMKVFFLKKKKNLIEFFRYLKHLKKLLFVLLEKGILLKKKIIKILIIYIEHKIYYIKH